MVVIRATVVCPHPPLLFRELAGSEDAALELRVACRDALSDVLAPAPDVVVLVGGAEQSAVWPPATPPGPEGFGRAGRPTAGLPLSLGVGRRLLDEVGWDRSVELRSVGWDAPADQVRRHADELAGRDEDIVLLVLGDGSARRGEKAPGYVDPRAFDFDEETRRALAEGDPAALLRQDPGLAEQLMAGGRAAFQVMAAAVQAEGGALTPRLHYSDDPFGVMYFVATWQQLSRGCR